MYELKLAAGAAALYRATLDLSIKLVHRRDRAAFRKFNAQHKKADNMNFMALELHAAAVRMDGEADSTRELANEMLHKHELARNAALNQLQNAQDDITFKKG